MEQAAGPIVSVIMPAYNAARYIGDAIRSVLAQTVPELELIIIDDCSRDDTRRIVREWMVRDGRIRLLENQRNQGTAFCRNRGLEDFRGRYAAFLDADDAWRPEKLEKQLALAEKEGAALVYSSYALVDEWGEKRRGSFIVPKTADVSTLLKNNVIGCSTVLLSGETARNARFSAEYYHEDYALWLALLRDGRRAVGVEEVLVDYRLHPGSRAYNKLASARNRWQIYRSLMNLSRPRSAYYLTRYAVSGIQKYRKTRGLSHRAGV